MSWVTVATADEFSDDVPLAVEVEAGDGPLELAIVSHDGKLYALENECTHGKVALSDGDVVGCTIECYLHGGAFDLATGEAVQLPATEPVRVFPVRQEGNDVQVDPTTPITDLP